jgi:predicted dehydrogenase
MVGMVEGNGHPYSWSAILNGDYDPVAMSQCPYPGIAQYLAAEPKEALGIPGARVTHIWCDDPADADLVARATRIDQVVDRPQDVLGHVDAVIIPTDKPEEHFERARSFVEAGVPVFIDKPLTDRAEHLRQFHRWYTEGRPILSTSCMRYAEEYRACRERLSEVKDLRALTMTMCKSWERYGIHALEGVHPFLDPGRWLGAANRGDADSNIVHLSHASGVNVVLLVVRDLYNLFGQLHVYGTGGVLEAKFEDTFTAFKRQLVAMVQWLRTGEPPVPFEQTVELMKLIIAAIRSRNEGGRFVPLSEVMPS